MNKIYISVIPLLFFCYLIGNQIDFRSNQEQPKTVTNNQQPQKTNNTINPHQDDKIIQGLSCTACHETQFPTADAPGLKSCPRKNLVSEDPAPTIGPDVVMLNQMSENYEGVIFSHKVHSQMSVMSGGCKGCHHYNTKGPVLKCSECHSKSRVREDVSVPDLKAAFHRQCTKCHQEWSKDKGCNTQCHLPKGTDVEKTKQIMSGKSHPELKTPDKLVWETNYEKGKLVTFYHSEHTGIFKLNCTSCHKNESCGKCHPKKSNENLTPSGRLKVTKPPEEHHLACNGCHRNDACQKCHLNNEMTGFNHSRTGFTLSKYHAKLSCESCHGQGTPKRLDRNCTSCHKDFKMGSFNHSRTGITLDEIHKEIDCNSCHINNDFTKQPDCKSCHDDKSYPKDKPGK